MGGTVYCTALWRGEPSMNAQGSGELTPKLWAALIAAIIATVVTRLGGIQLADPDKELINAIAPLIAGVLTGYWGDDDWTRVAPKPNLSFATAGGALVFWVLTSVLGFPTDEWWKPVVIYAGTIFVGFLVGWFGPNKIGRWGA